MKQTLVVMAAGIGSRYGAGIKQLEPVGPHGEIIMDYSIHDAIQAGFHKIIFIIRKEIEEDFREVIGNRIEAVCAKLGVEVRYAFQALDALPEGVTLPEGRKKPWGTGQAVLACKGLIQEPFAVINADDYYGKDAFVRIHQFLEQYTPERSHDFCMAGFILKNTLSEHGGVTRGICQVDGNGYLADIVETKHIVKTAAGAEADGRAVDAESPVSMNMWGLTPEFVDMLEEGFAAFFESMDGDELQAEYLLPTYIGQLLKQDRVSVKVLETDDRWFGVTYHEDKAAVVEAFKELYRQGSYGDALYGDMGIENM